MRSREVSDRSIRFLKVQYYQHRNVLNPIFHRPASTYYAYEKIPSERTMRRREWFATRSDKYVTNSKKNLDACPHVYAPLMRDPLRLAEEVRQLLTNDQFKLALGIVRDASRKIQCIVSWNHLIGWLLSKGELKNALQIYQEMKKRAQTPDSHTYTIIFKGCSQNSHNKQALGRVMAVYQSMFLDNSPVELNIIHINAVLKMCAVAGDIDCMLSIVAELPSSGFRAADRVTFVTVLNALRYHFIGRLPTPPSSKQLAERNRALMLQTRRIWRDIMKRWRNGDIWIDEELVCSMGRILLISKEKAHWDDILSLVEETMGIPRQFPRFSSARDFDDTSESKTSPHNKPISDMSTDSALSENTTPENIKVKALIACEPKFQSLSTITGASTFAKPGQNSLSLVLDAAFLLSSKALAKRYWKIFTEEHHVTPDMNNYVSYLRILRVNRASSEVVELLRSMPREKMVAKVFRIAMSSCIRDKNNHHSFSNSGKILDMMRKTLKIPDVKTMMRYIQLAMCSSPNTQKNQSSSYLMLSDKDLGSQILRASDRVYELLLILKSILFFEDPALNQLSNRHEFLVDLEQLVSRLIFANMHLIKNQMVPNELISELKTRHAELSNLKERLYKLKKSIGASTIKTEERHVGNKSNISDGEIFQSPSVSLPEKDSLNSKDF